MKRRIPLAWLQLIREKIRLLVALAGISFANILMFMQLGFKDALFEAAVVIHKKLQGDIFLISPQSTALIAMTSFSDRRLYQALAFEGVKSVSPLYIGFGIWKNPENQDTRQILILGFHPTEALLDLPEVRENLDAMKMQDVVLFDRVKNQVED